jgi:hypothetical protein
MKKRKEKQNKDISERLGPGMMVVVEKEIEKVLLMVVESNLVWNLFV